MSHNAPSTSAAALPHARIFWRGQHSAFGYSSPLGKLPSAAVKALQAHHGWREVQRDDAEAAPVFTWTTRRAADFPASGPSLPLVRQLPQSSTACVDDKVMLANLLRKCGAEDICPATFTEQHTVRDALESSAPSALYFVKHRYGVKGKAVQPMRTDALRDWLGNGGHRGQISDFAVQREVAPPALWEGRKFALRAHVLVAATGAADDAARAWLHRDVIVVPHAAAYDAASDAKDVHVSNVGRRHPPPVLTTELPAAHPAVHDALWPRVVSLTARCLRAVRADLLPAARCPRSTLYSLLAFDLALDASGTPWLLEINSHCALGDGTMASVEPAVYTRLVSDVVDRIVLPTPGVAEPIAPPAADDASTTAGRFLPLVW